MVGKTRKQQLEEMLAEEPNDPELRYALAMEYSSAGDDDVAVQRFADLSARHPDYVPSYYQWAQALLRLGHPEEARPVIETGIGRARARGDHHAAEELQGLLYSLE
jgi:predicted Zn-dependent protease